jgi:SAM-dependent methyltransferase
LITVFHFCKNHSWEQAYDVETRNFSSNPTDEGQIWFSESDAEGRILSYLTDEDISSTASFLDVGTGNGHLLFELIEEGKYEGGDLVGIDYSPKAVVLAQKIAEERGLAEKVKFYVSDCIKDDLPSAEWVSRTEGERGFDIVLDKGTFDAISLSNELLEDGSGRRIYESYSKKIVGVMKHGGLLMVTSCNWTEEELKRKLLVAEGGSLFPRLVGNGADEDWRQI